MTIAVKCTPSGDCDGLSVAGTSFELTNGGATLALDIEGTPTKPGYATFAVSVDDQPIGEVRAKVYSVSEMPVEGLPVQWRFSEIMGGDPEKTDLQKRQPEWTTDKHTLNSDVGSATITVVEAEGKTAAALNSWGYNNGHAYIKGLYYNDYWLMTIPVKYVASGTVLNAKGCFGGSGSAAAFFLLEYSADGLTWHQADGAKTETFTIKEKPGRGHLSRAGLRRTEIPRRRGMFVRLHVPRRGGYSQRQPLHPLAGLGQHPYHTEQHHHDGRRRFEPSGKDMVGFRSRVIEKQRIA